MNEVEKNNHVAGRDEETSTVCTTHLDKLNMIRWLDIRLMQIYGTTPGALKITACYKSGHM